jgi:hypothetical protein
LIVLHGSINEHTDGGQVGEAPGFTEDSKCGRCRCRKNTAKEVIAILNRVCNEIDLVTKGSSRYFCREVGGKECGCTFNRFGDESSLSLFSVVSELFGEPIDEQVALFSIEFGESSCGDVIKPFGIHVLWVN